MGCQYSRTTRRYRGLAKDKTQHLQERLDHAEKLLQGAGLIDQLGALLPPPSAPSSRNQDSQGIPLKPPGVGRSALHPNELSNTDALTDPLVWPIQSTRANHDFIDNSVQSTNHVPSGQQALSDLTSIGSCALDSGTDPIVGLGRRPRVLYSHHSAEEQSEVGNSVNVHGPVKAH